MSAYRGKHDNRWRYRFQFRGRRYSGSTAKGHNTKAAAVALERAHLKRIESNTFTGVIPYLEDFATRFLEHQIGHTSPLTRKSQAVHVRHLVKALGKYRIDMIDTTEIDAVKLGWKCANSTKNVRLDTLRSMMQLAVSWKLIPSVPKYRRLPTDTDEEELRFLSDQEAAMLIAAAEPQWQSMLLVAVRTGMRIGELRGLRWSDVDFNARIIRIRRSDPGRKGMAPTSPKSGKGRTVPMTPDCHEYLVTRRTIRRDKPDSTHVWPALEWRGKRRDDGPRSESGCKAAIRRAADKVGLKGIGWHTLRHTYASALVMRGVTLQAVQELLGHASIVQTQIYSHLAPGFAHHAAVAALDVPLVVVTMQLPEVTGE